MKCIYNEYTRERGACQAPYVFRVHDLHLGTFSLICMRETKDNIRPSGAPKSAPGTIGWQNHLTKNFYRMQILSRQRPRYRSCTRPRQKFPKAGISGFVYRQLRSNHKNSTILERDVPKCEGVHNDGRREVIVGRTD